MQEKCVSARILSYWRMAEVTIPKEKMNYTIDLLITMVTEEIAEETGKDRTEVLTDFLCSRTGR